MVILPHYGSSVLDKISASGSPEEIEEVVESESDD
jgi:hypothetical protein